MGKTIVVTVDNVLQVFTLTIRSSSGISLEQIKRKLQTSWEVVSIEETDKTLIVHKNSYPDW